MTQTDYVTAQTLALRSWHAGPRTGPLCADNWRVIAGARRGLGDVPGAATAQKWERQCAAADPQWQLAEGGAASATTHAPID